MCISGRKLVQPRLTLHVQQPDSLHTRIAAPVVKPEHHRPLAYHMLHGGTQGADAVKLCAPCHSSAAPLPDHETAVHSKQPSANSARAQAARRLWRASSSWRPAPLRSTTIMTTLYTFRSRFTACAQDPQRRWRASSLRCPAPTPYQDASLTRFQSGFCSEGTTTMDRIPCRQL